MTVREQIDQAIAAGAPAQAYRLLRKLWREAPGFVLSRFEQVRSEVKTTPCRLAILRSFTVEPAVLLLRAGAAANGIDLTVQVGDFNAYAQEILNPASSLYSFSPEVVLLAVQTRDIEPALWDGFADLPADEIRAAADRVAASFRQWVQAFRSHSNAHLILSTLEIPDAPRNGLLDSQSQNSQAEAIRSVNRELARIASGHSGVYMLDYDALVARHGRLAWHDESKWLAMRMPVAAQCLPALAAEWLRMLHPLTGRICKALVVDLDNTLWGGVIGEDGMSGIKLDGEYPGAAYRALQRTMLDLYRRGAILAICSKNNPVEAMQALSEHPGMLLRPQHFASMRINWNDKAQNLRGIAAELNVGIDALAFLDDNPVEREWVAAQLPEVTVIELPKDPMGYAAALRETPVFERLSLSTEDRERGQYYARQRMREELKQSAGSLEDFYRSLEMEVDIRRVSANQIPRVAQLTQKTNQFNLTTHRYSEQEIASMAAAPDWRVYSLRVVDRFGDNGIVGTAAMRRDGQAWEIDTFLLSCRVIGRTVETALLAALAEEARAQGAQALTGWFLPTRKNAPAKEFYRSHGFACTAEQDGASRWQLELASHRIETPPWIQIASAMAYNIA